MPNYHHQYVKRQMSHLDRMIENGEIPDKDTCVEKLVEAVNSTRLCDDKNKWRIYGKGWVDARQVYKRVFGPDDITIFHFCDPQRTWWYYTVTRAGALDGWPAMRGRAISFKWPDSTHQSIVCDRCKAEPQGGLRMALLLHYNKVAKKS